MVDPGFDSDSVAIVDRRLAKFKHKFRRMCCMLPSPNLLQQSPNCPRGTRVT